MNDVIGTLYWQDSDNQNDEDGGWRKEFLWFYPSKKPRYSVCDADGNHEPIYARDVPRWEREACNSRKKYTEWVKEYDGFDPLGEFSVKRTKKIRRNVVIYLSRWIGANEHGLACVGINLNGKIEDPATMPEGLRTFCCLAEFNGRWVVPWNERELQADLRDEAAVGYIGKTANGFYLKVKAEWDEPRKESLIKRDVLRKLKAAL